MKRTAAKAAVLLAMLGVPGSAIAADNTYFASYRFNGARGSVYAPVPLSFAQTIKVTTATAGERAAVIHQIASTIQGVRLDVRGVRTCSADRIRAAESDSDCPRTALLAQGAVKGVLGPPTDFTQDGTGCDARLDVWNGGGDRLIFFLVQTSALRCLGGELHTGQVDPWTATHRQTGDGLAMTIPIPTDVDYPLGELGGEVESFSRFTLDWTSRTTNGRSDIVSEGCSGARRRYSFTFSASLPDQAMQTSTTSGSSVCR